MDYYRNKREQKLSAVTAFSLSNHVTLSQYFIRALDVQELFSNGLKKQPNQFLNSQQRILFKYNKIKH